jgi:hypothetical protein
MNNYNFIFSVIKNYCVTNGTVLSKEIYYQLVERVKNKKIDLLDAYLEVIQTVGLIKFCKKERTIYLTNKGATVENLFV